MKERKKAATKNAFRKRNKRNVLGTKKGGIFPKKKKAQC